jgi:hypothetical protein
LSIDSDPGVGGFYEMSATASVRILRAVLLFMSGAAFLATDAARAEVTKTLCSSFGDEDYEWCRFISAAK